MVLIFFQSARQKFLKRTMYMMFRNIMRIISTDEDPSLRIESSEIINLRGVSTSLTSIYCIHHAIVQETYFKNS